MRLRERNPSADAAVALAIAPTLCPFLGGLAHGEAAGTENAVRLARLPQGAYAAMPAWSPDGKQIVFMTALGGKTDLWVAPANGEGPASPLTSGAGHKRCPAWSPDGKSVVFEREVKEGESRLFALDIAARRESEIPLPDIDQAYYPRFSPDGKRLSCHLNVPGGQPRLIAVADLADPDAFALAPFSVAAKQNCWYANWSPDGKCLVFSMGTGEAQYDLYRAAPESVEESVLLVKGHGLDFWASYSPDGARLLYGSWPLYPTHLNAGVKVAFLNQEGLPESTVTVGKGGFYPAWSPDGKRIAYAKDGDIWVVPAPERP